MKPKALVVGLTGGIGSGKSEALRAFRRMGASTVCLDEIAHRNLAKGGRAYAPVLRAFGRAILDRSGSIDRRALGRLVFARPALRRRLERLTHPAIIAEMRRRIGTHKRGVLVVDVPLLFEAGLEKHFDLTAVVTASPAVRLRRLRRRDDLPESELRRRMAAQAPLADKVRRADVVIDNDGTPRDLRRRIHEYHKAFQLLYGG